MGRLYIYLHEWLIFVVNVGKYTSPMDPSWVSLRSTPHPGFQSPPGL